MMHLAVAALLALAQNDKTRANSYDDAWEAGWKAHCQSVINVAGKTPGFVIHIGDSITHTWAYGGWIWSGATAATHTSEDTNLIVSWLQQDSGHAPASSPDPTSTNGMHLAMVDVGNRSMTAAGGIDTNEYLTGTGNGSLAMPSTTNTATAQGYVANASYNGDLHITTVAAAFNKAQFAVIMLGTNDIGQNRTAAQFISNIQTIVSTLEGQHIAVVLSTIPPHYSNDALAQQYNAQIRSYAQSHGLPLIDFYAEILARRPGTTWNGTLLGSNDVHPTASGGGYTTSSDPYYGGSAATHTTGAPCDNVGYLLRAWLTVQKLKEVKYYVIDNGSTSSDADADGLPDTWEVSYFGNTTAQNGSGDPDGDGFTNAQELAAGTNPTSAASAPSPSPSPSPTPTPTSSGGGGGSHKCGGSIDGPVSPWTLLGVGLATMALLRASRKTGF